MPDGFSVTLALFVALLMAALSTAYLWLVRRRQGETAAGIGALAEMRWREFSRLVVEALQGRGFEAEAVEQTLERGPQAEIRLRRNSQVWLLSCKLAGPKARLGVAAVRELAEAARVHGAHGAILATPARIEPDARKAAGALELYDGDALWALVGPMLPDALHDDITASARKRSVRETVLAWVVALVIGALAGFIPALMGGAAPSAEAEAEPPAPSAPASSSAPASAPAVAPASAAPTPQAEPALGAPAPADPNREQFERGEVIHAVAALPWVERVLWSTSSTLLIHQREDVEQRQVREVCSVLGRYADLRASRLQLQPPPGSQRTVRFLQCQAY
jgi:restriction system protein